MGDPAKHPRKDKTIPRPMTGEEIEVLLSNHQETNLLLKELINAITGSPTEQIEVREPEPSTNRIEDFKAWTKAKEERLTPKTLTPEQVSVIKKHIEKRDSQPIKTDAIGKEVPKQPEPKDKYIKGGDK